MNENRRNRWPISVLLVADVIRPAGWFATIVRGTTLFLASAIAASFAGTGLAGQPHPFTVHDLVTFDRLSDPRVSPDNKRIVFVVSSLDLSANKRRSHLWLVDLDGAHLHPLTSAEGSDTSPRWSPDGKVVWFLSTRSGSQQIWRIPVDGGEAQSVTKIPLDVGSFAVSRDGANLAFSVEVFPDTDIEATKKQLDETKERKATGRIYERLLFRHWDQWSDGRRSHLFAMPTSDGTPIDVMKQMDADAPSKPFSGDEEYQFTPNGRAIVFTAKNVGRAEAWSTDLDLWLAPIDGSRAPRQLTTNPAWDSTPCFSPDGKKLAYLSMKRPGYESDRARVMIRDWPNGEPRSLTENWDRSVASLVWSPDGGKLFVTAENEGQTSLFAVNVADGSVLAIQKTGTVRSVAPAGSRIVYAIDSLTAPTDLYATQPDGTASDRLTEFNHDRLAEVDLGQPEQFTFEGWNHEEVHGYLVRPARFDASKKYPVAFLIHGGPQGSFGNEFHYRWNAQTYTGAGYAAVMVDFHGSTGYGQAFTDSIRWDWGGKPLEDLKLGLAAALARFPFLDGKRVAALGASYGAYMINWIAGAWPDQFRCLVSHDGNLDERAAYYMTEELWFPEWDHRGTPWDNSHSYEYQNPQGLVDRWKTPILVIHGGQDFRIVDAQGFATFTAAQRRGIPSKLLYFPDESHWVLKPQNSILWHETVLGWLDQWTK